MKKFVFPLSALFVPFFILSLSAGTSSCEKENDTDTVIKQECPASILGLWIGTYTVDQLPNDPPRYFSFIIKPDGTMIVESKPLGTNSFFGSGTWTLNNNTLSCTYIYPSTVQGYPVSQSANATYDKTALKLTSGVWTDSGAPSGTGKFTMSKVN